jgi:hypothetical protein
MQASKLGRTLDDTSLKCKPKIATHSITSKLKATIFFLNVCIVCVGKIPMNTIENMCLSSRLCA